MPSNYYGKSDLTKAQAEEIRQVFKQTGSLEYAKSQAEIYVMQAKALIGKITDDSKYRQLLDSVCDLMVKREK